MTNKEAGVWLKINSMLAEQFKCSCAFTADDAKNLSLLSVFIKSRSRVAAEDAVRNEREARQRARDERRTARIARECGLDAYDVEVRLREKRRMQQSVEVMNNGHKTVRW